jgi:hypothetical protein
LYRQGHPICRCIIHSSLNFVCSQLQFFSFGRTSHLIYLISHKEFNIYFQLWIFYLWRCLTYMQLLIIINSLHCPPFLPVFNWFCSQLLFFFYAGKENTSIVHSIFLHFLCIFRCLWIQLYCFILLLSNLSLTCKLTVFQNIVLNIVHKNSYLLTWEHYFLKNLTVFVYGVMHFFFFFFYLEDNVVTNREMFCRLTIYYRLRRSL